MMICNEADGAVTQRTKHISPWVAFGIAALACCSQPVPTAGRYSDPDKPVVDFAKEYSLETLPLRARVATDHFILKIMAKEDMPEIFRSLQKEYEKVFGILTRFFQSEQKMGIICRIAVVARLPDNYKDTLQRKDGIAREHLLILYGERSQWELEILRDTASETHELGHVLCASKHYIAWFEEGLCEELEYQYLAETQPQRADAVCREWEGMKNDKDLQQSIWKFQPWDDIRKIEATMKNMKDEKASKEGIAAFYRGAWSVFDKRYRYSWGVLQRMMKYYGPKIFADILRRYRTGHIEEKELQALAWRALRNKE